MSPGDSLDLTFAAALAGAENALLLAEFDGPDLSSSTILFVNDAFTRVTGHAERDAVGKSTVAVLDPFTVGAFDVHGSAAGRERSFEHLLRRSDGSPYWAEVTFGLLAGEGSAGHVILVIRAVDHDPDR